MHDFKQKSMFRSLVYLFLFCFAILSIAPTLSLAGPRGAPKEPIVFQNPQIEKDYIELSEELRCLVCQNQNLIDSNAELADDLRREVAKMLKQGKDKEQVVEFMVERYGDFVLYNPPFKPTTWLLWGGPFVLMFFALFILLKKINAAKLKDNHDSAELSDQEKETLQAILKNKQ